MAGVSTVTRSTIPARLESDSGTPALRNALCFVYGDIPERQDAHEPSRATILDMVAKGYVKVPDATWLASKRAALSATAVAAERHRKLYDQRVVREDSRVGKHLGWVPFIHGWVHADEAEQKRLYDSAATHQHAKDALNGVIESAGGAIERSPRGYAAWELIKTTGAIDEAEMAKRLAPRRNTGRGFNSSDSFSSSRSMSHLALAVSVFR